MRGNLKSDVDLLWRALWKDGDDGFHQVGFCTKVPHSTASKAKKHIERITKGRRPARFRGSYHYYYYCQECQAYHVGHRDTIEKRLR